MFLFLCIVLPAAGELFQRWLPAVDIVLDLLPALFFLTASSRLSAPRYPESPPTRSSSPYSRSGTAVTSASFADVTWHDVPVRFPRLHRYAPCIRNATDYLFSSNAPPDLASSLDSLWKTALRSRLSRQWFLFFKMSFRFSRIFTTSAKIFSWMPFFSRRFLNLPIVSPSGTSSGDVTPQNSENARLSMTSVITRISARS